MINAIDVTIVYVEDQDRLIEFFVDKLGFEKAIDAEMWPGARWVEVKPRGATTGLVLCKAADFNNQPDDGYPLTFCCDDLQKTHEACVRAGVDVGEINNEGWGSYFTAQDPDGRQFLINDRANH